MRSALVLFFGVIWVSPLLAAPETESPTGGVTVPKKSTEFTRSTFSVAVRGEEPDCPIILPANPKPSEVRAAEELQDYVGRITGVRLAIERGTAPAKGVFISIVDDKKLGEDGFRLTVKGGRLAVVGGKRGILYGVYELLEKYGHVGWFTSWRTVVPKAKRFAVPGTLVDEQVPAFVMRDMSWRDTCENPEFAAHLRLNGPRRNFPAALGGVSGYRFAPGLGVCHTVDKLISPAEFAKDHPEYFGLVDGKRVTEGRIQLCLTNPDVLRICTERVLKSVREHPEYRYFGVSQGDSMWTVCKCEKCLTSDRKYGDAPSGTFLAFVNAIAVEVEKVRPDAVVETLAYRYTRKPPVGIRPRHNVMPCLCTIECDYSRPIPESDYHENVAFLNDIRGWREISPFLYVWDYTVNFSHYGYPFANFRAIQGNLRFFRESGVEQIFEQGDGQGMHAWFGELRTYLLAKLEWNPDADVAALTDAFFKGYYGPAAPLARADFDEVCAFPRGGEEDPVLIYEPVTATNYPDAFFARSAARWAEATKRVADRPEYQRAVRGGRFSSDYVRVQRYLMRHGREGNVVLLSRNPNRFATPEMREMIAAAGRINALVGENPPVRLSEEWNNDGNYVARIRALAKLRLTTGDDSVQFGTDQFSVSLRRAVRVRDPGALSGEVYLFDGTHHEWSVGVDAARFLVDPGAKFRVRVRFRADKTGKQGEIFRAGVYDPVAKKNVVSGFCIRDTDVKGSGYAWYDLFSWEPKGSEFFWLSPGIFDRGKLKRNESFTALAVDRIELVRERLTK